MQESYGEGVATHTGSESCVIDRKVAGEALTGVRAGRANEPRKGNQLRGADAIRAGGRPHRRHRQREMPSDPARAKTLCMYGCIPIGNREILGVSARRGCADRIGKSQD
jgi:hypothetical protein